MKAQALVTREDKSFAIEEVAVPDPGPNEIGVRTLFSGVSIGTEFALIRGKISWGPFPICTGYMATGVVDEVGNDVSGYSKGDRVYVRGNRAINLADGSAISCASGAHASYIVTQPDSSHGAALLLAEADAETASMFVMPAVGLFGVDMANPRMGQTVLVYGCGLIGLGVVAACVHRGCTVVAVDLDEKRLAVAEAFGADHLIDGSKVDVHMALAEIAPDGADVVFESTGIPACIDEAIELCRTFGTFVWQGNYGSDPISMKFLSPHGRKLTMFFPCDDGLQPCRKAVIRNMMMDALKWEKCITHHIDSAGAPELFSRIDEGDSDILGATIRWSE
jgi:2-desacetyl-2-hydroxyethyl bacteriochlorophyllide A dehydrogenase